MRMLRLAALFFALAPFLPAAPSFPQDASDLKPDPAATFGALPNGLRYVVRPNREPRNRATLRLLVLSGSLEERDDQRGLAHFLEHMAFNGSTHYPPGTLVEYFQRLGMSFGGDTNAYTSFDHTAFEIELPDTRPATLAEGLRVLADFAGGLLLPPAQIKKERPIILSEKRDRDSVEYRQFVASFNFLLADSLLPRRVPIGLQSVIEQAGRDRFLDLYDTWYRPERMVAIVIGDIDPAAAVSRIADAFGGVRDRAPARPNPDMGHVITALGLRAGYDPEPEAAATTVSIDVMTPYSYQQDNSALRLKHLPRDLAVAIINRRLEILSKKEGAPFTSASATVDESFNFVRDAGINITCTPNQWQSALALGEQELRRALQFGFTVAELREAEANYRNGLEQAAATAATRRSPDLAVELIDSLVTKTVFTSPEEDLALMGPALDRVTLANCETALRESFAPPGRYVMVSGNAEIPGDAEKAIIAAYQAAHATAVTPPDIIGNSEFAYTDFGPAGKIVERRPINDLDLTLVTFANGVRVNLKKTPFEANHIRISVRVGAGRLVEPRDQPGLGFFSEMSFASGGLGRHSTDDLARILAGRTVSLEFKVGNDALQFAAATNREDLLLQLQFLAAELTDPGYRPEAQRIARKNIEELYNQLDHDIQGPLNTDVPRLLASGDPRFGLPSRSEAMARNLAEEKAWLGPQLATGPIEIGIVGDIDIDATLNALARTVGALPARRPKPSYVEERKVAFPGTTWTRAFAVPTEISKSAVLITWPTADSSDIHRERRLLLLSQVLDDRLRIKIREQRGAYDPEAGNESSDTFTGYGMMLAEVVVAPESAQEIQQAILDVAADLQRHGVTPDELERAKLPVLTAVHDARRTNGYWLDRVLLNCQEFPQRLDWSRTQEADINSITVDDLNLLAKAYLGPDRAFCVTVSPAK